MIDMIVMLAHASIHREGFDFREVVTWWTGSMDTGLRHCDEGIEHPLLHPHSMFAQEVEQLEKRQAEDGKIVAVDL